MPEKPINAIAMIPAVTKAIGTPSIDLGTLVSDSCSLIPEKMIRAIAKPTDVAIAKMTD